MLLSIAGWVKHHYSTLIIIQLTLLFFTLLLLLIIALRRYAKKLPLDVEAQDFDKERVAFELHEEIVRLTNLRNRLWPKFAEQGSVSLDAASSLSAQSGLAEREESTSNVEAIESKIRAEYLNKIQQLEDKITELQSSASSVEDNQTDRTQGGSEEALRAQQASFESEKAELQRKIQELEAALSEYELFEEDLSDVKRFKEENEQLRNEIKKLREGGAAAGIAASTSTAASAPASASATEAVSGSSQDSVLPASKQPGVLDVLSQKVENVDDLESLAEIESELIKEATEKTAGAAQGETAAPVADDLAALLEAAEKTEPEIDKTPLVESGATKSVEADVEARDIVSSGDKSNIDKEIDALFAQMESGTLSAGTEEKLFEEETERVPAKKDYVEERVSKDPQIKADPEALLKQKGKETDNLVAEFEKLLKEDF